MYRWKPWKCQDWTGSSNRKVPRCAAHTAVFLRAITRSELTPVCDKKPNVSPQHGKMVRASNCAVGRTDRQTAIKTRWWGWSWWLESRLCPCVQFSVLKKYVANMITTVSLRLSDCSAVITAWSFRRPLIWLNTFDVNISFGTFRTACRQSAALGRLHDKSAHPCRTVRSARRIDHRGICSSVTLQDRRRLPQRIALVSQWNLFTHRSGNKVPPTSPPSFIQLKAINNCPVRSPQQIPTRTKNRHKWNITSSNKAWQTS
jgi:hypothetical protein